MLSFHISAIISTSCICVLAYSQQPLSLYFALPVVLLPSACRRVALMTLRAAYCLPRCVHEQNRDSCVSNNKGCVHMLLIPIISELGEKPSKAVRHYMRGARCETRMRVYAVRDLEITRTVIQSYSSHCTLYMHVMHPYTFYFLSTFFTFVRIYMHMHLHLLDLSVIVVAYQRAVASVAKAFPLSSKSICTHATCRLHRVTLYAHTHMRTPTPSTKLTYFCARLVFRSSYAAD